MIVKDDLETIAKNVLKNKVIHIFETLMKGTSVIDQLYVNVAD